MSSFHLDTTFKRILLEALILVTVALAIGLSVNYQMVMNAFNRKAIIQAKPPVATPDVAGPVVAQRLPNPVELDEIEDMLAEGALLVDARNIDDYKAGHLEGAISLPLGEINTKIDSFRQRVNKEQALILYCNGFGCPDSFELGKILLAAGYQDVSVYEGGYPEWRDQGRAVGKGAE